jgi:hypothetical protein
VGEEVFRIKSKKDLEPLYGDKAEEMNVFIKKEKIKFSNEHHLMKLFVHFATISR